MAPESLVEDGGIFDEKHGRTVESAGTVSRVSFLATSSPEEILLQSSLRSCNSYRREQGSCALHEFVYR